MADCYGGGSVEEDEGGREDEADTYGVVLSDATAIFYFLILFAL